MVDFAEGSWSAGLQNSTRVRNWSRWTIKCVACWGHESQARWPAIPIFPRKKKKEERMDTLWNKIVVYGMMITHKPLLRYRYILQKSLFFVGRGKHCADHNVAGWFQVDGATCGIHPTKKSRIFWWSYYLASCACGMASKWTTLYYFLSSKRIFGATLLSSGPVATRIGRKLAHSPGIFSSQLIIPTLFL